MKRFCKQDYWFEHQPPISFLDELRKPVHTEMPEGFGRTEPGENESDIRGMYLVSEDPGEAWMTSREDFERFLQVYGLKGKRYPLRIGYDESMDPEAWRLETDRESSRITAADADGIRRALVYLEGVLTARMGPYLPIGTVTRKPEMRLRMTRCFFSPINRPPKYGDELSDDIDYYPEEYLNRLMHDGANAVWIYTRFSDLVPSGYVPDYGIGGRARLDKLNRVIAKCAGYGIRVYVFAIEPVAMTEEQISRIPEADGGIAYNGRHLLCVNSTHGRKFVEELGRRLFEACPELGGFISITYGERPTSCSSAYSVLEEIGYRTLLKCPRCSKLQPGQVLANAAAALASGIHQAKPEADVISWSYGHRFWPLEDVRQYVRHTPEDVILMQNFEEMGYEPQLGKTRLGVDYWLSYPGPSPLFRETARTAREKQKRMYMKTQVCCSHEIATVPYVPVPGILFDKYRAAHELGVTGVMQCWYFGNYPSLMSRAAGELAFMKDFSDKRGFLEYLASICWGKAGAGRIADAWEKFEEGYRNYPLNIMFSYYGPMHDGPVWQLALKPKNFSLPRSWQTLDPADGDRIGECLLSGHTLAEAITLCEALRDRWTEGLEIMRRVPPVSEACREQVRVAETIGILFSSGTAILRFYQLREELGYQLSEPFRTLESMREIVYEEIRRGNALAELCRMDGRLGYHSEGEGYKFFVEKLVERVEKLRILLETEFPEVEERIHAGKTPLEYYEGIEEDSHSYAMKMGSVENAQWEPIGKNSAFRAAFDEEKVCFEFRSETDVPVRIDPEWRLMWPAPTIEYIPEQGLRLTADDMLYYSVFGEKTESVLSAWSYERTGTGCCRIQVRRSGTEWSRNTPFKLRLSAGGELWCTEENPVHTLGKGNVSPGEYGWILPSGACR